MKKCILKDQYITEDSILVKNNNEIFLQGANIKFAEEEFDWLNEIGALYTTKYLTEKFSKNKDDIIYKFDIKNLEMHVPSIE